MIVLVINNGSTSSRFSVVDCDKKEILASGGAENIRTDTSYYKYENIRGDKEVIPLRIDNCTEALTIMSTYILSKNLGVLNSINDIDVIGHRVVHGGKKYTEAVFVNENVLEDIKKFSLFSPLHNKRAL